MARANAMECKEAKQKLSEALDKRLGEKELSELAAHVEGCASCKADQSELRQIQDLINDLSDPKVDPPDPQKLWTRLAAALGPTPGDVSPFEDLSDEEEIVSSGAFDIKSMVAAAKSSESQAMSSQDFFGLHGSSSTGEPAPASVAPPPVLMPISQRPHWLIPVFVGGGILVLSVLALGVVLFVREGRKQKQPSHPVAANKSEARASRPSQEEPAKAPVASPKPAVDQASSGAAMEPDKVAEASGDKKPADLAESETEPGNGMGSRRRVRYRASSSSSGSPAYRPRASERRAGVSKGRTRENGAEDRPKSRGSDDPLAALLGSRSSARTSPQPDTSDLPATLTSSQIRKVMSRASGAMQRCFERHKEPGLLRVAISVKGSTGRIASASVTGKFKGSATAGCALRAVNRLRFPRFQNSTQRFTYPFLLR